MVKSHRTAAAVVAVALAVVVVVALAIVEVVALAVVVTIGGRGEENEIMFCQLKVST